MEILPRREKIARNWCR